MADTTTINITTEQHERLEQRKQHPNEAFADVVERLLADDEPTAEGVQDALGLPDEAIPDDLDERLGRIEDAVSTAENRTGSIERQLEEMTR